MSVSICTRRSLLLGSLPALAAARRIELNLLTRDAATVRRSRLRIDPGKLALVVVDMWTAHSCSGATEGMRALVPAMNAMLDAARAAGMLIVFASSGDDLKRWEGKPQRTRITSLSFHPLPASNGFLPDHGGNGPYATPCMCRVSALKPDSNEPLFECRRMKGDHNQNPALGVGASDVFIAAGHYRPGTRSAIRSWGEAAQQELWNLVRENGITHLLYAGCATNMCVINREFAMIQMKRLGLETILVRDLTAAMTFNGYNPILRKLDPEFTPAAGTRYAVEYIEANIGPSIPSEDILRAGGKRGRGQR